MNMLWFTLLIIYFFSGAHQRVLSYFGLTNRDDKLIFIGFFIPSFLEGSFNLFSLIFAGAFGGAMLNPILMMVLSGFFIYLNYNRL